MFGKKPQTDAEFIKEWKELRRNKFNYVLIKGIISYGLPLGFIVAGLLFLTKGIGANPAKILQILLVFSVFGIFRAVYRFSFFEKQYKKLTGDKS